VSYRPFTAMLIWSVFIKILPTCLFVIIIMYIYFIDISQGIVETHLRCCGIYNNHIIANCLQSVPVKEFWKSIINCRSYMDKSKVARFLAHSVNPSNSVRSGHIGWTHEERTRSALIMICAPLFVVICYSFVKRAAPMFLIRDHSLPCVGLRAHF